MAKKSQTLNPQQQADFLRRMKEMQDEATAGFNRKRGRKTMDKLGKAFSMKKSKGGTIKKMKKGMKVKGYKAGGKFPDLTGDGKVTQADILKGRGVNVKKKAKGGTIKKMAKGGTIKKMSKGGTIRKMTKGGTVRKNGGKSKVRGAGIARKGVRPAQMR